MTDSIPSDLPRRHTEAILSKLREDPVLATRTFSGDATSEDGPRPVPYVVVYPDNGTWEAERLDFSQQAADWEYQIHSVHEDVYGAQAIAGRVYAQLMNQRPVVAGRSCWPIRQVESRPADRDTAITPNQFYCVDTFVFRSTPKKGA